MRHDGNKVRRQVRPAEHPAPAFPQMSGCQQLMLIIRTLAVLE